MKTTDRDRPDTMYDEGMKAYNSINHPFWLKKQTYNGYKNYSYFSKLKAFLRYLENYRNFIP
ncbi:hypothetical protein LVD17_10940 [Fulvivirga ulvae]|uniref:hypothetical protein n=1 Tax=Fulvivirga ulvae TaxID=2904245 RepID=UPI001F3AEEA3|nr:hypothetical protein [Fulvivirga ulvae]UII34324.1 hypothetical protein LVD17_10940 [Fulvivirga ulvae]